MIDKDVIGHLREEIMVSINDDIIQVIEFHKNNKGGFHSIPRHIFCYIDYLGQLVFDDKSETYNAVKYMQTYFDSRYKEISILIYEMWRHGTVHEFDPKEMKCGDKLIVWASHINGSKSHLRIIRRDPVSDNIRSRWPGINEIYEISLNFHNLADDLIKSVDRLINELDSDDNFRKTVQERHNARIQPKELKDNKLTTLFNKYIVELRKNPKLDIN